MAITEHRSLGYLITPYLISKGEEANYMVVSERLRAYHIEDPSYALTGVQVQLVRLTEKYSDENLARKFNKKGTMNDFYKNVKAEEFSRRLVPYIEEIMIKCIELIRESGTPLYFKRPKYHNLYSEDLVELCYEDTRAVFNFEKMESETRYYLTIRHKDQKISLLHRNIILLVNEPCRMLYQNKLYFFDDITGSKLLPFFDKEYVSIPKSVEQKYYSTFILNAIKSQEVNHSGFDILDVPAQKKVILSLESDLNGFPIFLPLFYYNEQVIRADDEARKIVSISIEEGRYTFRCFEKDQHWEEQVITLLTGMGLQAENQFFRMPGREENALETFYGAIEWLREHQPFLDMHDIQVSQVQLKETYFTGKQQLDLRVKQENDWFDIHAVVQFGEFSIPFVRLKKHIQNNIREFKLPNNQIAILPKEWFSKYSSIFGLGKVENQSIKLKGHHFTLMDGLLTAEKEVAGHVARLVDQSLTVVHAPENLKADLRQYQFVGYNWLHHLYQNNFGGCLADDMGLGKTIQTISLLLKLKKKSYSPVFRNKMEGQLSLFGDTQSEESYQPASLVVLPVSLVHNWENEIAKFAPDLRVYVYKGSRRKDKGALEDVAANYDVILTTYGTVRSDAEEMARQKFFFLILDEGQYIKNVESKTYQTVISIQSDHRIVLTGTPIENSLSDLWAQMNFLNRGILGSMSYFKEEYLLPIERDSSEEASARLKKLISPFILRRTKEQVAKDLPDLTQETLVVQMTDEQYELYESEKSAVRNMLFSTIEEKGMNNSAFMVLQALTRLRQLAIHPRLIESEYGYDSGKFREMISMLAILVSENHKILVFSSFVKHLRLLAEEFDQNGWSYSMLTGQTTDRKQVIQQFQEDPTRNIFLISLKAGGVGLNLTSADYIFISDPWWNPAAEMQAISRAHRIGQDKKVFVYRFISENSIEEKIQKLQARKMALADEFINSNDPFKAITKDELYQLFD